MRKTAASLCMLITIAANGFGQSERQDLIAKKYESGLQKIIELQKKIRKIHPLLKKFYPVTIVEDKEFFLFDVNPKNTRYDFIKATRPAMIVPKGIRAAFPLDFYDDKMACVVTGDVFDDLGGYATIFHEFIHCAQMECCEQKLKPGLGVARKAQAAKDFMWELNHPFPYEDNDFEEVYTIFLELASKKDAAGVSRCRTYLKEMLNVPDYEYMVWQEWKEGFARLIENRVRKVLGLEENHGGSEAPYSRVSFYEGGSRYIETLFDADKELEQDIEELFHRMFRGDQ